MSSTDNWLRLFVSRIYTFRIIYYSDSTALLFVVVAVILLDITSTNSFSTPTPFSSVQFYGLSINFVFLAQLSMLRNSWIIHEGLILMDAFSTVRCLVRTFGWIRLDVPVRIEHTLNRAFSFIWDAIQIWASSILLSVVAGWQIPTKTMGETRCGALTMGDFCRGIRI